LQENLTEIREDDRKTASPDALQKVIRVKDDVWYRLILKLLYKKQRRCDYQQRVNMDIIAGRVL